MKIAVIQASSQKEKNEILYECTQNAAVKRSFCEMYTRADQSLLQYAWQRKNVLHYVLEHGKENEIKTYLEKFI